MAAGDGGEGEEAVVGDADHEATGLTRIPHFSRRRNLTFDDRSEFIQSALNYPSASLNKINKVALDFQRENVLFLFRILHILCSLVYIVCDYVLMLRLL